MKRTNKPLIWLLLAGLLILWVVESVDAEIQQLSYNNYVAGIFSNEFEYFAAPQWGGRQRQSNWCWAACIQMVLNYHGLYITQEQIVQRVFGTMINRPGQPQEILSALSGWAPDMRGRYSEVHASTYIGKGSDIVNDLAYRWPLIVGLTQPGNIGHAYVLSAVYYQVDAANEPIFYKVALRDPWPGNISRLEMSWAEFRQRLTFIARVYVTRLQP